MARHDANGLLRILGMNLLVGIVIGLLLTIVWGFVLVLVMLAGAAGVVGTGATLGSMSDNATVVAFIASAGVVGLLGFLAASWVTLVASAFTDALTARALGYWTSQFDVAHWRGQDDPMPFEAQATAAAPAPAASAGVVAPVAGVPTASGDFRQQEAAAQWQATPTAQPVQDAGEVGQAEPPVDVTPVSPVAFESTQLVADEVLSEESVAQSADGEASTSSIFEQARENVAEAFSDTTEEDA